MDLGYRSLRTGSLKGGEETRFPGVGKIAYCVQLLPKGLSCPGVKICWADVF